MFEINNISNMDDHDMKGITLEEKRNILNERIRNKDMLDTESQNLKQQQSAVKDQQSAVKDLQKQNDKEIRKLMKDKEICKLMKEMGITPKSSPVSDTTKSDKKVKKALDFVSKKKSDTSDSSDSSDSSSDSSLENSSSKKISKNLRERMEKASKGKTDSAGGANKDQIQSWICKYSNKSLEDVSKMSRDELQSYLLRILKKH